VNPAVVSPSLCTHLDETRHLPLVGAKTDERKVPQAVAVDEDAWSGIFDDAGGRSWFAQHQPWLPISTDTDSAVNEPGSVNVDFGPEAPPGDVKRSFERRQRLWVSTRAPYRAPKVHVETLST
jgi:hypothetical protein